MLYSHFKDEFEISWLHKIIAEQWIILTINADINSVQYFIRQYIHKKNVGKNIFCWKSYLSCNNNFHCEKKCIFQTIKTDMTKLYDKSNYKMNITYSEILSVIADQCLFSIIIIDTNAMLYIIDKSSKINLSLSYSWLLQNYTDWLLLMQIRILCSILYISVRSVFVQTVFVQLFSSNPFHPILLG